MRALRKLAREAGHLEFVDMPVPEIGPHDLLVRVDAAAVCGTDGHILRYTPDVHFMAVPVTIGHEVSGTVVAVGDEVQHLSVRDRVVTESVHYCGECLHCKRGNTNMCVKYQLIGIHIDGGFAEFVKIPARYAHRVPDDLSSVTAALVEPVSVALNAVEERGGVRPGDAVVVIGCGPIGLFSAQVAKVCGASTVVVTGRNVDVPSRLRAARSLGFVTVNSEEKPVPEAVMEATNGAGADIVFECSGSSAGFNDALSSVRKGGRVVLIGLHAAPIDVDMTSIVRRGLTLVGTVSARWGTFERAITLLRRNLVQVSGLVTEYGFMEARTAVEHLVEGRAIKPVVRFRTDDGTAHPAVPTTQGDSLPILVPQRSAPRLP